MKYKPEDLAYLAGIIDGEGCIGIYPNKNKTVNLGVTHRMSIQVGMCDIEAVQFIHQIFGGSMQSYKGSTSNRRVRHHWLIASRQAQTLLREVLPYLKTKSKQAELAIEFQDLFYKGRAKITDEDFKLRQGYVTKLKQLKHGANWKEAGG